LCGWVLGPARFWRSRGFSFGVAPFGQGRLPCSGGLTPRRRRADEAFIIGAVLLFSLPQRRSK
jgi:hypothetical protein